MIDPYVGSSDGIRLKGFQRWAWKGMPMDALPSPDDLELWFQSSPSNAPPHIAVALLGLDRLAENMISAPAILGRMNLDDAGSESPSLQVFGLDQTTNSMRLRAAVARSWRVNERYVDAYLDRFSGASNIQVEAPAALQSIADTENRVWMLLREMERNVPAGKAFKPEVQHAFEILREAVLTSEQWSADQIAVSSTVQDDLPETIDGSNNVRLTYFSEISKPRPDRFWWLRLAEIYTVNFGRPAPLHFTDRENRVGVPPDEAFGIFLKTVLHSVGWPSPEMTSVAAVLRNLRESRPSRHLRNRLSELHSAEHISYADLPSNGFLIDFGIFRRDRL